MKMEPHWTEKPSGKNSLRLLGQMMKTDKYDSLFLEIPTKIVEGMLKVKKQMHGLAVY